jgi:hypothetical protein
VQQDARHRWWRKGSVRPAELVASFPAALVFAEVDGGCFRLDGLAGIPVPAGGPPADRVLGGGARAGRYDGNAARHPFSLQVCPPGDGWLGAALVTLERWTAAGTALMVEVLRRGGMCQARMSDGTAFALFDVRRSDGLFWLTIGTPP